ncbi:MAG: hypothetical protein ACRC7S_18645 [Cetobacterium sp.]
MATTKKETKTKTTKTTTKATAKDKKPKKEEVAEVEVTKEETPVKKSKRELRNELKKLKHEIEVEIVSLSTGRVSYTNREGDIIFDLNQFGDKEMIDLEELYRVASKHKNYFERHYIAITDIDNDDYEIEDILDFLNVRDVYNDIEDYDRDYIHEILFNMDNYDFEKTVSVNNIHLTERLSDRAKYLYRKDKFDSMSKAKILADKLKIDDLFELI